MKKTMKLLSLLAVVILMSGCVKYDIGMEIRKDKSVNISIISAVDSSLMGDEQTVDEDEIKALEDKGFTATKYEDDNWNGYTLTKKYKNIDEISSKDPVTVELTDLASNEKDNIATFFQKKSGLFTTKYIANFTLDARSDEDDESDEEMDEDMQQLLDRMTASMELNYHVTLPSKASSSNATKVSDDGKTLTWNLKFNEVNDIKYEFAIINPITVAIAVGIGALVIMLVVLFILKGRGQKKAQPVGGGVQPMPQQTANTVPTVDNQPSAPMNQQFIPNVGQQPAPAEAMPNPAPQSFINPGTQAPEAPVNAIPSSPTPPMNQQFIPNFGQQPAPAEATPNPEPQSFINSDTPKPDIPMNDSISTGPSLQNQPPIIDVPVNHDVDYTGNNDTTNNV